MNDSNTAIAINHFSGASLLALGLGAPKPEKA